MNTMVIPVAILPIETDTDASCGFPVTTPVHHTKYSTTRSTRRESPSQFCLRCMAMAWLMAWCLEFGNNT